MSAHHKRYRLHSQETWCQCFELPWWFWGCWSDGSGPGGFPQASGDHRGVWGSWGHSKGMHTRALNGFLGDPDWHGKNGAGGFARQAAGVTQTTAVLAGKSSAPKKQTQSLMRVLQFVAICAKPGRVFMARLLNFLRDCPELGEVTILDEVKADVDWWLKFLPFYNGVSIIPDRFWSEPDSIIAGHWRLVSGEIFSRHLPPEYSGPGNAHKRSGNVDPDSCPESVGEIPRW